MAAISKTFANLVLLGLGQAEKGLCIFWGLILKAHSKRTWKLRISYVGRWLDYIVL